MRTLGFCTSLRLVDSKAAVRRKLSSRDKKHSSNPFRGGITKSTRSLRLVVIREWERESAAPNQISRTQLIAAMGSCLSYYEADDLTAGSSRS